MTSNKLDNLSICALKSYERFFEWQKTSATGVPGGDAYFKIIAARYTPEEAYLLAGIPFSPKTLKELAEIKKDRKSVV